MAKLMCNGGCILTNRTMRACQVCGKPFYGDTDYHYCPSCARLKKLANVIKIRICEDCGTEFYGGPRAKRCPDCAYKAQQETNRRHKKNGTKRPLGSIDNCQWCGANYTVVSGRQKYCPKCRREAVLAWQREHKKGYSKASGQDIKKQKRRKQAQKICVYCLRTFMSNTSTNVCSDYCRVEQKKLTQCISDINRGYKRNYDKYIKRRNEYRNSDKKHSFF